MNQADIRRKVIRTIEDAFAGPTGLVGEKCLLLHEHEASTLAVSPYLQNGLFTRLLDSFFDFVLDSFTRKYVRADANEAALLISSFWTIRSAFNLFWDQYFSNSIGILRTGLESVFLLTAERKGYIGRSRLIALVSSDKTTVAADRAKLKRKAQQLNAQVYRHLIGSESSLSKSDQETIEAFIDQLHRSVHYAFPAYARLMVQSDATGTMSVFPQFEEGIVGIATVAFTATSWTYLHLLRLFLVQSELPTWYLNRLRVLDETFQHASSTTWSTTLTLAWQRLLKAHYEPVE